MISSTSGYTSHTMTLTQALIVGVLAFSVNSFDLEGSSSSYAKFPKWKPCQNGSISFEFRTYRSTGVLLYTDDGGQFDFFELKLNLGTLRLRFNMGGGERTTMMSLGGHLNDYKWHTVKIERDHRKTTLHVDKRTVSSTSKSTDLEFGDTKTNSYVYIGGIPRSFMSKLMQLALPSILFEPRFKGGVRNLMYFNCAGPQVRGEMMDHVGVRTNVLDSCMTRNPCLNGGLCISTDSGATCDCDRTDYEGSTCQNERNPSEVTFRGQEYLAYDLSTRGDPIVSSKEEIDMYFKTKSAEGLIFYSGDAGDYIIVSMNGGTILLRISLGSGVLSKVIRPSTGSKFTDNTWHHIVIKRNARQIIISVDDGDDILGTTAGPFKMLSSSTLYLGGSPDPGKLQGSTVKSNFTGCLKKVKFTADGVHLRVIDLARDGSPLITVQGHIRFNKCMNSAISTPLTFATPESLLRVPRWDARDTGSIMFSFRTTEKNGLLLYNNGVKAMSDFFAMELWEGFLYLIIDLGSGPLKIKASKKTLNDGIEHQVALYHRGNTGTVAVDNILIQYQGKGSSAHLDLDGLLFIGGVSVEESTKVAHQVWSAMLGYGYVGCLDNLAINGIPQDLAQLAKDQDVKGTSQSCDMQKKQCPHKPCLNSGKCLDGWNRFVCDCSETSYYGQICNEKASVLSFDGSQHMKLSMPEESQTETEDISIRVKTSHQSSLVFATSSPLSRDRMNLSIDKGRARLDVNLGSGSKTIYAGQAVSDDKWHTIKIKRHLQDLSLQVDNGNVSTDIMQGDMVILDFKDIQAGSLQNDDSGHRIKKGFVGQMQNLVFNKMLLFEMARSNKIDNLEVTATFDKNTTIKNPFTSKTRSAYVTLPPLQIYSTFSLSFQFKTTEGNGVILYNRGSKGDFIAIELVNGQIHLVFNYGDGPKMFKSVAEQPLNNNVWHKVAVIRPKLQEYILKVDSNELRARYDNSAENFDLDGRLYVTGVPHGIKNMLSSFITSKSGYQGCLASLDLNGRQTNILKEAKITDQDKDSILEGCTGPKTKCTSTSCLNQGRCIQSWERISCDCDLTSYTGSTCKDTSVAYRFGIDGGLVTFTHHLSERTDSKHDIIALGFSTKESDAVLVRVESGDSNDYIEIELVNGNLFVVYNVGTMDHPIGELFERLDDGDYHVVRFIRSGPNSTVQVDNLAVQTKNPEGQQLSVFNNQAQVYVGGKKSSSGALYRPFKGTMAGLVFNGIRILDLVKKNDPRITIEGEVFKSNLQLSLSTSSPKSSILSNGEDTDIMQSTAEFKASSTESMTTPFSTEMHSTTSPTTSTPSTTKKPSTHEVTSTTSLPTTTVEQTTPRPNTDDIIFTGSGSGSGCATGDDEDCRGSTTPTDDLITTSVKITRTTLPSPTPKSQEVTTTMRSTSTSTREGSGCDDDDEGCVTGSGDLIDPIVKETGSPPKTSSITTVPSSTSTITVSSNNMTEPSKVYTQKTDVPKMTINKIVTSAAVDKGTTVTALTTKVGYDIITTMRDVGNEAREKKSSSDNDTVSIVIIVGIACGSLLAILLIAFIIYKVKRRDTASYKVDESKNYTDISTNGASVNGKTSPTKAAPNGTKKDVKEWYV